MLQRDSDIKSFGWMDDRVFILIMCSMLLRVVGWVCFACYICTMSLFVQSITMTAYAVSVDDIPSMFQARQYDAAVAYLQEYLQANREDYRAWDYLGMAYYYQGQPKQALKILKGFEAYTDDLARSYLFQGLSFTLLKKNALAAHYLKKAAAAPQSKRYSRIAAFELVIWYYNRRKPVRAKRWAKYYLEKYANSKNATVVERIRDNLKSGIMRGEFRGIDRPDVERAFFKHAAFSLWDSPHYWFVELGSSYINEYGQRVHNFSFTDRSDEAIRLFVNAGIGLGPYNYKDFSYYGGYLYSQRWDTDTDRILQYYEDPLDIGYFPFQADFLVQSHKFIQNISYDLWKTLRVGTELAFGHRRIGSEWIPGPENWSISESFVISNTLIVTPFIGYVFSKRHSVEAYTHIALEERVENEDFSYQSFTENYLPISYGVIYNGDFPKINLNVHLELYRYEFLYNDPYLDLADFGILPRISQSIFPGVRIYAGGMYSLKKYTEKQLVKLRCDIRAQNQDLDPVAYEAKVKDKPLVKCDRDDQIIRGYFGFDVTYKDNIGMFLQGELFQSDALPFSFLSFWQWQIRGGIMLAFPSPYKVQSYNRLLSDKPYSGTLEK